MPFPMTSFASALVCLLLQISDPGGSEEGGEPFLGSATSYGHVASDWSPPGTEVGMDARAIQHLPTSGAGVAFPQGRPPHVSTIHELPWIDGTPRGALQLDATTGEETHVQFHRSPRLSHQASPGQVVGVLSPELTGRSWDSDLSLVTASGFPWTAACLIEYRNGATGQIQRASATLIDASHVITAGYVLHRGNGEGWNTDFRVIPAWDGDSDAYGESAWENATVFDGWAQNGDLEECMGFLRLRRPVGFLTGWLGTAYDNSGSFFATEFFNAAGYPTGCYPGAPDRLYYGFGVYDWVTPRLLEADVYWSCPSDVAGAGVYYVSPGGSRNVMGCRVDRCTVCFPNDITDVRMTQEKYQYFHESFLRDGYSSTQPDYVSLNVNLGSGDGAVEAGETLSHLDYLVANAALYNPLGTQSYSVDVYLSTNDQITTSDTLIDSHVFQANFNSRSSVRVTTSPPTIPLATPSGDYWIGVVVSGADDHDPSNNSTNGWDAVPISVTGCQVNFTATGQGLAGSGQFEPLLFGSGAGCEPGFNSITLTNGLGGGSGFLWISVDQGSFPFKGGTLYVGFGQPWWRVPIQLDGTLGVPGTGFLAINDTRLTGLKGATFSLQGTMFDPGAVQGLSMTNSLEVIVSE